MQSQMKQNYKISISMKKTVVPMMMGVVALSANVQAKGKMEVYDFEQFKLHVYYTNDALGDASYIVEGKDALITLEEPLFKDNIAEFATYVETLQKPIVQRISDYHVGGTAHHAVIMPQGMPKFVKEPAYSGMMQHFSQVFGDAITELPTGETQEVEFYRTYHYADISFLFSHGANTDFPAASILIGGKVYYTHWTPLKTHINPLQLTCREAVDAELEALSNALSSGAELFIGGHGGATDVESVEFRKTYLQTLKKLLEECSTADEWISRMKQAFPGLPAEESLPELAKVLYK